MASQSSASEVLNHLYHDSKNRVFLVKNSQKLYDAAKEDSLRSNVTHNDVAEFKQKIESIAQTKATKRLGGRKHRGYSFRKYKLFGNDIISGDLAFLPPLKETKGTNVRHRVLLVLIDCFSRKISLNFMPDAKSTTTLKTFEKSLLEDFQGVTYRKFLSDRG